MAYKKFGGNTEAYVLKHMSMLVIGIVLMWLTHKVDFQYFSGLSKILVYIAMIALVYTLLFGTGMNSAKRWITIPGIGKTVQTSDFAKVALMMYIAQFLSKRQKRIDNFKNTFLPVLTVIVTVCLLIAIADLSTALVLFITSILLLFIGRILIKYLLALAGIGGLVMTLMIVLLLNTNIDVGRVATWKSRIENYVSFKSGEDASLSYQNQQANIAIANGGFFGQGPGKSQQRNFLPLAFSDFIYAIIIEEYGLLGGLFVMSLYLVLLWRTVIIVINAPKAFGALLAIGMSFLLVIQALMNMGVAVQVLPNTGLPLPFISMGGTSLIFTSFAVGVILSVSRSTDKSSKEENEEA